MSFLANLGASALGAVRAQPVRAQYLVQSIVYLACAFGLHLSGVQIAAIAVVTAAVLGELTHTAVTPLAAMPPTDPTPGATP